MKHLLIALALTIPTIGHSKTCQEVAKQWVADLQALEFTPAEMEALPDGGMAIIAYSKDKGEAMALFFVPDESAYEQTEGVQLQEKGKCVADNGAEVGYLKFYKSSLIKAQTKSGSFGRTKRTVRNSPSGTTNPGIASTN